MTDLKWFKISLITNMFIVNTIIVYDIYICMLTVMIICILYTKMKVYI